MNVSLSIIDSLIVQYQCNYAIIMLVAVARDNGRVRNCGVRTSSRFLLNNNNYYYYESSILFFIKTNPGAALQTSFLWSGFPLCVCSRKWNPLEVLLPLSSCMLLSIAGIVTQFILLSNLPFFPFLIGHAYCQTLSFRSVEDDRNTTETITSITTVSATYNTSTGGLCADGINNDLANSRVKRQ